MTPYEQGYDDGYTMKERCNLYKEFSEDWYEYNRGYDNGCDDWAVDDGLVDENGGY